MLQDIEKSHFSPQHYLSLNNKTDEYISSRVHSFLNGVDGRELHKKLKIPFLRLSLPTFDFSQMLHEALQLESFAVSHRSRDSFGWKSLCVHGIAHDKTMSSDRYGFPQETDAPYQWTEIAKQAPVTVQFLKQILEKNYFDCFYRVRFMYLEPNGEIHFHQDRDENNSSLGPLNIALNMPEECYWVFKKWGTVPFDPGSGYAVDVSNQHGVWNLSSQTRVHMILHGRYGDEYYRSIEAAVEQKRKTSPPPVVKIADLKNKKSKEHFSCVLWQRNDEVHSMELFDICKNMSEHFLRLKANRQHTFSAGVHLSDLLAKSFDQGHEWALVCTPGTLIKDGFFSQAREFIKSLPAKTFLIGHLLDRKERWYGLHPQSFFINLNLWDQLGRPSFGISSYKHNLPNVERSIENVHDDYTPLFLKRKPGFSPAEPKIFGWNWICSALRSELEIINFTTSLRATKDYLYPEQNQSSLLKRLQSMDLSLEELKYSHPLSPHQDAVFDFLHIEAHGLEKKIFVFNTEQVRSPYQDGRVRPIDLFCGLPAGFMDMHLLHRHQFSEKSQLLYFDVNPGMIEIKKELLSHWDGYDLPNYWTQLEEEHPHFFSDRLVAMERTEFHLAWQRELELWGGAEGFAKMWDRIKALNRSTMVTNIVTSPQELIQELENYKGLRVALWYSNCFNYTPGLARLGWKMDALRSQGVGFLNALSHLARKNHLQFTIYGEDVVEGYKVPGFGRDLFDVFS